MRKIFYLSLFEKVAALLEGLVTYHVFADDSKRTAFLATTTFFRLNGQDVVTTDTAVVHFILVVATKKKSIKQIAVWLKKNSRPIS